MNTLERSDSILRRFLAYPPKIPPVTAAVKSEPAMASDEIVGVLVLVVVIVVVVVVVVVVVEPAV